MIHLSGNNKAIVDAITTDITKNRRSFLSGERCRKKEIVKHVFLPILADGLNFEEVALINSTLPKRAREFYLAPLDKGLSGSKVFAARYITSRNLPSKFYVLKIGDINKISKEARIVEDLVSPYINLIQPPVYRQGIEKALIVQEYAGLSSTSRVESLRSFTRQFGDSAKVIEELFTDRFAPWYFGQQNEYTLSSVPNLENRQWNLSELFERYLQKGPQDYNFYPNDWSDLPKWVQELTGFPLGDVLLSIERIKQQTVITPVTIIHGDLHAQNVLVGHNNDCWLIDFAWSKENSSPIIDLVMLECSFKFFVMPWSSSLRSLIAIEHQLCTEYNSELIVGNIPYRSEIINVLRAIKKIRDIAANLFKIQFDDYIKALSLMTFSLATHPNLNRPYVFGSLQILTALEERRS